MPPQLDFSLMKSFFTSLLSEAQLWCIGQSWWWRVLLLGWFGIVFVGLLKNPQDANLFGMFNLCIHEMGHLIFAWGGHFLHVAGGTITQLAFPFLGMWNFYVQKDYFAISLCFGWLSTNLFNVSVYMADARSMQLDLVSIGGPVYDHSLHDWHVLFGQMNLLPYDHVIAGFVWFLAVLSMLMCFVMGAWLVWQMMTYKIPPTTSF